MIQATLISIGNEILIGRTPDTNVQYIARKLAYAGIQVVRFHTISDQEDEIIYALNSCDTELIITTGGLGATSDDITRNTLCKIFDCNLKVDSVTKIKIEKYFKDRNLEINPLTATMANIPDVAEPLSNDVGVAPGIMFLLSKQNIKTKLKSNRPEILINLPGVPHEMIQIFSQHALPAIKSYFNSQNIIGRIHSRTIRTIGLAESKAALLLKDLEAKLSGDLTIAYNPSINILDIRLTLTCSEEDWDWKKDIFDNFLNEIEQKVDSYFFGYDSVTLEETVGRMLKDTNKKIALAESCTGGNLSGRLISVPGASEYVVGGIIAYSNNIKVQELKVSNEILQNFGAVSEQCAIQMAKGIREKLKSDVGLSTTGIAGPGGATDTKPVGTVWIGYSDEKSSFAKEFHFEQDRNRNIERTIISALNLLRMELNRGLLP